MEAKMKFFPLFALLIPAAAFAQMSDADYCAALTQSYQTYVSTTATGRSPEPTPIDAQNAIDQCKAGNTAAGIPVLERKLRDAKITLPKRS
jgi:hypothetical protein